MIQICNLCENKCEGMLWIRDTASKLSFNLNSLCVRGLSKDKRYLATS